MTKRISLAVFVCLSLLGASAVAGPYVGLTIASDNDVGHCDTTGRCETARAFVGYDKAWGNGIYTDVYASYEDRIDGRSTHDPSRVSATIMKRW